MRIGLDGRAFEYCSGEDPILGYHMAKNIVKGIQDGGVMANAKHWINNNQEIHRWDNSANIDERTQYEMYYWPFMGAIDAGVSSAMCSYNKINHIYSCANKE